MTNFLEETNHISHSYGQPLALNGEKNGNGTLQNTLSTYRALLSLTSDLCCIIQQNGSIKEVSASFLKTLGYSKDEIQNQHWIEFVHPYDEKQVRQFLCIGDNSEKKPTNVRYRFRKKNGRYIWLRGNCKIIAGNSHEMYLVICSQDLTKKLKKDQVIQQQQQELEQCKAELENFTYLASHDLQEPLRIITSYLQLLESRYKKTLDQDGMSFIGYTMEAANHMKQMVRDLQVYSCITRKYQHEELLNLNDVLANALHILRDDIMANAADIQIDYLPSVKCNKALMLLIWQNIISNAIKYRSEQELSIQISVKELPKKWVISIADNGIGIEEKYHQTIFEPFERLHGRKQSGNGIGLAIVKKILERYGQRIWIKSRIDQGTTFYFTLPKS